MKSYCALRSSRVICPILTSVHPRVRSSLSQSVSFAPPAHLSFSTFRGMSTTDPLAMSNRIQSVVLINEPQPHYKVPEELVPKGWTNNTKENCQLYSYIQKEEFGLQRIIPIIVDKAQTTFLLAGDPETSGPEEVTDLNAEPSNFYRWGAINDELTRIEYPKNLMEILRVFSTVEDRFPSEWKEVKIEEVREVKFR